MERQSEGRILAVLLAGTAALWLATGLQATGHEAVSARDCTVTLMPDTVVVAADPVDVQATYTEAVGDSISVSVSDDSGIEVVSATKGTGASATITLNTRSAQTGEWPLTLAGESGECRGTVSVAAADQR